MNPTFSRLARAAALALLSLGSSVAQNQPTVSFVRDYCVKVANGKGGEFAAFAHEVTAKVMQARVDAGEATWASVIRVVTPAGTTARCDYHIVYGNDGKLPEPASMAASEAALQRAGIHMTAAEMAARRDTLSRLVSLEVMRTVDSVQMPSAGKGAYVRLNHYKVRSGQTIAAWVALEKSTWKPLVMADNADGHKSGWSVNVMMMPSGDSVWSNGTTVDIFPDWEALMRGIPLNQLWPKVHGNRSLAEWSDRLSTICERQLVEITQVVEFAPPKSATSGGNN